jgi:hexosaminidase
MPKLLVPLLMLVGGFALSAQAPASHTLLPVPSSVNLTPARLALDSAFTVELTGFRSPRLERAVTRAVIRLEGRIAKPLSRTYHGNGDQARLVVNVKAAGFETPDLQEDESYQLEVSGKQATLTAPTVVGAIRGLETLLQLQSADANGYFLQGARIEDAPRFKWRGLLVDVSRHFEPVEQIKRTLDGMAMVKLNVLHWHLSDDQGFRVESTRFPRLHELGSDGLYYTQDQIREVVDYATDRGIRVVPEFDMPGHTTAWLVGYPELGTTKGPFLIARTWGVLPDVMDPTRESTYRFLDGFIQEIARLFPDRYWHVGGDEVNPKQWQASPAIQAYMKAHAIANEDAMQVAFNRRLFAILKAHGKEPVGWDEILQPDLPTAAVIQSWRGVNYLTEAAKQGRRAILSAPYYLDHIKLASEMYLADPLPASTDLTPAQQALVLGGEACMWAEYVTPETIDSRIWPRLGTVAERFWSPREVNDVNDMYRRLEVTSRRLTEVGLNHETHTDRMIRRFAGGADATLFSSLLDYARPRGFGGRGTNQFSPLTRLIDAARPDPWNGWRMLDRARSAAAGDPAAARALREDFARMAQFRAGLEEARNRIPLANDGIPVAGALADLSRVGEQALAYLSQHSSPPPEWQASADSILKATEGKTFGLLRPVGADAVRSLVNATRN